MADPTFQDMLNLAIATGGNNQLTDVNSPTAKSAFTSAINAQARRLLAEQAGRSAVMQAREQQWLRGERSAADGFATEAEKKWVEASPKLIGSQRPTELPGGVTRSVLPDGYTVLTDAQGKIIGTNRPLDSVVPLAGETKDQARAAINRGEATDVDRARLGEALRNSIFSAAAPAAAVAPVVQAPFTNEAFLGRLRSAMGPSFTSPAAPATTPTAAPAPAAPAPAAPAPAATTSPPAPAIPAAPTQAGGDLERLRQMEATYEGKMAPSEEEIRIAKEREGLYKQLEDLRALRDQGRTTTFLSMGSGRMPSSLGTQTKVPLSGKEKAQVAERIAALEKLLEESVAKETELGAQLRPDQAFMDELMRLRAIRETGQAPQASPSQVPQATSARR